MKVFVSGAAGVIARQLIPILTKNGHEVYAGDIKVKPSDFPVVAEYIQDDLNNLPLSYFEKKQIEVFLHLAATFERTSESIDFWEDNFLNNIKLSHHLMNVVKNANSIKKVLFASSYLVYDENQYLVSDTSNNISRLQESSLLNPRNLIGSAKLYHAKELEFIIKAVSPNYEIVIPRIFRGYGLGSRDVISRWVRMCLLNQPLDVFNECSSFDFIYSKDSASGIYTLAFESKLVGPVNLGSGISVSINELLATLSQFFPDIEMRFETKKNQKVEKSQAEISKIINKTSWRPSYTLRNAISEIVEYEKSKI